MTTVGGSAAARISSALNDAGNDGFAAWSGVLQDNLGEEVEIRHRPPVAELDGWRDRETAVAYLRDEVVAFPRAFQDDFAPRMTTTAKAPGSIDATVVYAGTLAPDGPRVEVGFQLEMTVADDAIVKLDAAYLPDTDREQLIGWLKAVERAGGFDPPPPQRR